MAINSSVEFLLNALNELKIFQFCAAEHVSMRVCMYMCMFVCDTRVYYRIVCMSAFKCCSFQPQNIYITSEAVVEFKHCAWNVSHSERTYALYVNATTIELDCVE